jgi:Tail tubular protein
VDRATIINSMLSVVGESGVSSTTSTHPSVQTAARILDTEDVDFQQVGWWFNREYKLTLVPNSEGKVSVPASALDIRISDVDVKTPTEKLRYTRRGDFIYDTFQHTNVIKCNIIVDVVLRIPIDSLPAVAASYVMHKAREAMYVDDDGDTFKTQKLETQTAIAWQKLQTVSLKMLGANALDNPTARRLLSGMGQGWSYNANLIGGRIR